MRFINYLRVGLFVFTATNVQAAVKDHAVKYHQTLVEDGQVTHENRCQNYGFRVEIVSDNEGTKPESSKYGRPFVAAERGERYSVRLYNPLPVRVAVNLSVDGLNSITGKPSGITDGEKWVIEPYSFITVPGWQVSSGEARRFFFTDKPKSYAKWRGDEMGKDLAANCGVIGAAYFWNQAELNQYYDSHPIYRTTRQIAPSKSDVRKKAENSPAAVPDVSSAQSAASGARENRDYDKQEPQEQAGTGMGERESNPTYEVEFHYDTGMYRLSQAVLIYYDFAKAARPNPFPAEDFSPEMPQR